MKSVSLTCERLEGRDVPSFGWLLGDQNQIYRFDTEFPVLAGSAVQVTGLAANDRLDCIDFSPWTGFLMGFGRDSTNLAVAHLYRIDGSTGIASQIGGTISLPKSGGVGSADTIYDIDFDGSNGHIWVFSGLGDQFVLNPATGATVTTYVKGSADVMAYALDHNYDFSEPFQSLRYGINTTTDKLVVNGSAFGNLGVNVVGDPGFDIAADGKAYAVMRKSGQTTSRLYSVNLSSGAATELGSLGSLGEYKDIALAPLHRTAVGADAGSSHVKVFDTGDGLLKQSFFAYGPGFKGGVRVATGDVNRDGFDDVVTAPGKGGPHIKVFSGKDGSVLKNFLAYGAGFPGGVYVACADVNHDGFDDIVTAPGQGGGPHVKVFSGKDLSLLHSFLAYVPTFTGGVRVAAGDLDGDLKADLVTGTGPGAASVVKAFRGSDLSAIQTLNPYVASFQGGVYVAVGDLNQDGKVDIATGAGEGGAPRVKAFHGQTGALLANFLAGGAADTFGVRVASADSNGDGDREIVVGFGPGAGPAVTSFGKGGGVVEAFAAFDAGFKGGVFVG